MRRDQDDNGRGESEEGGETERSTPSGRSTGMTRPGILALIPEGAVPFPETHRRGNSAGITIVCAGQTACVHGSPEALRHRLSPALPRRERNSANRQSQSRFADCRFR